MTCLHATTTGCNNCKKSFPSAKNFRCAICMKKEDIEENNRENIENRQDVNDHEDKPAVKVAKVIIRFINVIILAKTLFKIFDYFIHFLNN